MRRAEDLRSEEASVRSAGGLVEVGRVSVCIPSYNGERYILAQLRSVLISPLVDEVLVSDDGSSDGTLAVLKSIDDARLRVLQGPRQGLIRNYEFLLTQASGEVVFLADQDDVWMPEKVETTLRALEGADLVVSDCSVVDEALGPLYPSFFALRGSRPGLLRNLVRNSYLGCCMAMRRRVLEDALPFPPSIAMHDWWLGLVAEAFGRVVFLDRCLVQYRRHGANASSTAEASRANWRIQIRWRFAMLLALGARALRLA